KRYCRVRPTAPAPQSRGDRGSLHRLQERLHRCAQATSDHLRVQHRPDDSADSKQRHGEADDDAHGHHALEVSHHNQTPTPTAAATNATPKAMSPNVAPRHPRSRRSTSGAGSKTSATV